MVVLFLSGGRIRAFKRKKEKQGALQTNGVSLLLCTQDMGAAENTSHLFTRSKKPYAFLVYK